jgi:hypothetical protein
VSGNPVVMAIQEIGRGSVLAIRYHHFDFMLRVLLMGFNEFS